MFWTLQGALCRCELNRLKRLKRLKRLNPLNRLNRLKRLNRLNRRAVGRLGVSPLCNRPCLCSIVPLLDHRKESRRHADS